jgi:hypothetical protein
MVRCRWLVVSSSNLAESRYMAEVSMFCFSETALLLAGVK